MIGSLSAEYFVFFRYFSQGKIARYLIVYLLDGSIALILDRTTFTVKSQGEFRHSLILLSARLVASPRFLDGVGRKRDAHSRSWSSLTTDGRTTIGKADCQPSST